MAAKYTNADRKVIHPELSYKIIGACFRVYNGLGWGHKEIIYQRALAEELRALQLPFIREKAFVLCYGANSIGRYIPDFIVDDKVIVELKVVSKLGYTHIRQVLPYLRMAKRELAILVYFTKDGVKYRRVLNAS